MLNPATQPQDQLNEFTEAVRRVGTYRYLGRYRVKLRNGDLVRPLFKEAEDETCSDCFITEDRKYYWNLDGTSITSRDYDMMEIVNEVR